MTRAYVFVEGASDAAILKRVLPHGLLEGVEVVAATAGGLLSLARTVLVRRRKPVAVLMDADTTDPDLIRERRAETEGLVRMVAGSTPFKLVTVVPEIEAWFFAAPESVERVLGQPVPPEFVLLGKRDPKGVLQVLAGKAGVPWDAAKAVDLLDERDLERLRALPEVVELVRFLESVQAAGKAA
ncbi:MAG: DUF4276 family protein [Gemmataceae bacterium]|nr:DUF4276 family protein [Gemmataceae bacterium]